MKLYASLLPFFSLLISATTERVSYYGYKAFSVTTNDDLSALKKKLDSIEFHSLGYGKVHGDHFDIAVSPNRLSAFEALDLETTLLSEDLGAKNTRK